MEAKRSRKAFEGLSWVITGDSHNGSGGIRKGSDNPERHLGERTCRGQDLEEGVLLEGGAQTATCGGTVGAQHVHTSAAEARRKGKSQPGVDHHGG